MYGEALADRYRLRKEKSSPDMALIGDEWRQEELRQEEGERLKFCLGLKNQ